MIILETFSDFPAFVKELEARPVIPEKNGAGAGDQLQAIHTAGGKNLLMNALAADPGSELEATPRIRLAASRYR